MKTYEQKLESNIWKIYIFRALRKRVYWPVLAIYALSVAGLSPEQFGIALAIGAFAGLLLEIPSGYISDVFGHKETLVASFFIGSLAPLSWILFPNFFGVTLATVLFVIGMALSSGTFDAFFHETLIELGRPDDFIKVMTRAQSVSLFVNAVLIGSIPFLYPINPILPFLIGFVLMLIAVPVAMSLTTPKKVKESVAELEVISFSNLIKSVRASKQHLLFFMLGISGGLFSHAGKFRELYFQDIGIPVKYFGLILAASSLLAGITGWYFYRLKEIKARIFYGLDFLVLFVALILVSLTTQPVIGAVIFVLYLVYLRNRKNLITGHLLKDSPTRELKATYLSLVSFFTLLHSIWVPVLLGVFIGRFGSRIGHGYFALVVAVPFLIIYLVYLIQQKRANRV